MLKYVKEDLFKYVDSLKESVVIPHVCNCRNGFGAGFVLPLQINYPIVAVRYHELFPANLGILGYNQQVTVNLNLTVINMISQDLGGKRPLHYPSLVHCMEDVATQFENQFSNCVIVAPMFGSSLAGGNWSFIENLIEDIWTSKDIDVTICWREDNSPHNQQK